MVYWLSRANNELSRRRDNHELSRRRENCNCSDVATIDNLHGDVRTVKCHGDVTIRTVYKHNRKNAIIIPTIRPKLSAN